MNLAELLQPSRFCFHAVQEEAEVLMEALEGLRAREEVVVRHLRGSRMGSPRHLFDEWAAALQFPVYFGENWDAFDECLNDLEWLPSGPLILALLDADCVLDRSTDDDLEILARILKTAAAAWSGGRAFHVLLQWAPGVCEPGLTLQLRRTGALVTNLQL